MLDAELADRMNQLINTLVADRADSTDAQTLIDFLTQHGEPADCAYAVYKIADRYFKHGSTGGIADFHTWAIDKMGYPDFYRACYAPPADYPI